MILICARSPEDAPGRFNTYVEKKRMPDLKCPIPVEQKAVDHTAGIRNRICNNDRPKRHRCQEGQYAEIHQEVDNAYDLKFCEMPDASLVFSI